MPLLIINHFPLWDKLRPTVFHSADYAKNPAEPLLTLLNCINVIGNAALVHSLTDPS